MRGTQYAAASRLIISVSGILDRPVKPGDDGGDFGRRHNFTSSRHTVPELCFNFSPFENRGRGECRVPNAPAAWCALGVVKYAHQYSQRRHRVHPAFPTRWLYGLYVLSPVTSSFLPPSPRGLNGISYPGWADDASARLDISNGCQDHTTSPYATTPLVLRARLNRSRACTRPAISSRPTLPRPPHPASRFVTIGRNAPLLETGWGELIRVICPTG
jgi:hypothetical protein